MIPAMARSKNLRAAAQERGWLQTGRVAVVQSGWNGGFGAGNNYGIRQGMPDGAAPIWSIY